MKIFVESRIFLIRRVSRDVYKFFLYRQCKSSMNRRLPVKVFFFFNGLHFSENKTKGEVRKSNGEYRCDHDVLKFEKHPVKVSVSLNSYKNQFYNFKVVQFVLLFTPLLLCLVGKVKLVTPGLFKFTYSRILGEKKRRDGVIRNYVSNSSSPSSQNVSFTG